MRGLSIREFAKMIKVSPTYISKIENNKVNPSVPVLEAIASALNTVPGYFFEDESALKHNKFDFLQNPDSLTVEEALDMVLKSPHVMFDGKPVGEMDEDILMDIRDTVVAILKYKANLKKAVAGMRGVLSDCLAVVAGMG